MLIRNLLAGLGADRLDFHQTYLDTAVLAKETDKGRGLEALLALSGTDSYETIAVGDSEADLPMFRVARRSFAPSHISCRPAAVRLGCRIADGAFQPGLLGIVRSIVQPRRSEEHTSELQSRPHLVCRLLLEKKKHITNDRTSTAQQHAYYARA